MTVTIGISGCTGDDNAAGGATSDAGAANDASTNRDAGSGGTVMDAGSDAPSAPDAAGDAPVDATPPPPADAVYTMTNAASGNAVVGFARAADGSLTPMAAPFPTGGNGSGAALGEQGAITYDVAHDRILAVNAGDDSVSILPVSHDGTLGAAVRVAAGAGLVGPKSVTVRGDVAYVLFEGNASTPSRIAGWDLSGATPAAIAGSTLALSSDTQSVDPAQIQFTPDGKWLVVTEKAGGGMIDTFAVDAKGVATKVGFYPPASDGDGGTQKVPYGFGFFGAYLVVSEAGSTGVGSYTYANGAIAPVTGGAQFLPTDPAPCWVAVASDWAYVANARGPDVSGFTVSGANGTLAPIGAAANAVVATTGKTIAVDGATTIQGPTDEAVSADGKYLYVLDSAVPAIGVFGVNADGTLARVGSSDFTAASLSAGVVGIAAR
jgi:hypothetical protein